MANRRGKEERAVGAGAEALGQQVVGPARGVARRPVARVGEPESHRRRREREREQHRPGRRARPAVGRALHDPRSTGATTPPVSAARRAVRQPEAVDPAADEAEHGRQQGDATRHHHRHAARCGDPERPIDARAPTTSKPRTETTTVPPAKQHGAAGGVHRHARRLAGCVAPGERLPVAGHDEQGVVDPDADADHDHERQR